MFEYIYNQNKNTFISLSNLTEREQPKFFEVGRCLCVIYFRSPVHFCNKIPVTHSLFMAQVVPVFTPAQIALADYEVEVGNDLEVKARQGNRSGRSRGPRKRHWCFTSFLEVLPTVFDKDIVRYCCYQSEVCAETKRPHFQGYIEFFDNKRVGQVKAVLGECHLEFRRGSRTQARQYCLKEDTAVIGTKVEFGEWRQDVTRKRKLCDMLKTDITLDDLIEESPHHYVMYYKGLEKLYSLRAAKKAKVFRNVVVDVYIGDTGTGKTRRAIAHDDHYLMPAFDTRVWFDGYRGEKVLIIDDFYGNIKYGTFLRMLDGHELQMEVKGSYIWAQWTKVIITSNVGPDKWYKKGLTPALSRRITNVFNMNDYQFV